MLSLIKKRSTLDNLNITISKVENAIKKNGKYALLVQNSKHFIVSILTDEEYKTESPKIQSSILTTPNGFTYFLVCRD